ncbi:MAG TPA: thioredoxin domain-containing protein [Candidatus Acidoferrales bacterium]|nr:thioredoxin domain-containing protein [Candidatus Acidoferrales bacterium]
MRSKAQLWTLAMIFGLAASIISSPAQISAKPPKSTPPQARSAHTDIATAKTMGMKSAPIEVEIFSDFQCPVCRQFYFGVTKQLIDEYVTSGKVYLVHHDFPLPIHAHSQEAAKWADAAAAIGRFQEVEDALYSKQDSWAASGRVDEAVAAALSATEMKRVRALVDSSEVGAAIQHDEELGKERNVNGTPSIFVTHKGQMMPLPAQGTTYTLLKQYLDYLLRN